MSSQQHCQCQEYLSVTGKKCLLTINSFISITIITNYNNISITIKWKYKYKYYFYNSVNILTDFLPENETQNDEKSGMKKYIEVY